MRKQKNMEFEGWYDWKVKDTERWVRKAYSKSKMPEEWDILQNVNENKEELKEAFEAGRETLIKTMCDRIKQGKAKLPVSELLRAMGDFKDVPINDEEVAAPPRRKRARYPQPRGRVTASGLTPLRTPTQARGLQSDGLWENTHGKKHLKNGGKTIA